MSGIIESKHTYIHKYASYQCHDINGKARNIYSFRRIVRYYINLNTSTSDSKLKIKIVEELYYYVSININYVKIIDEKNTNDGRITLSQMMLNKLHEFAESNKEFNLYYFKKLYFLFYDDHVCKYETLEHKCNYRKIKDTNYCKTHNYLIYLIKCEIKATKIFDNDTLSIIEKYLTPIKCITNHLIN